MRATSTPLFTDLSKIPHSDWQTVKLGDVLELKRRWIKLDPDEYYTEIGVRSYGNGIFHKTPILGLDLGTKRVLRIEPNDLVFNNVFAWEGAVAVAGPAENGTIGSHRFITFRPISNRCDVQYLQYYFRCGEGLEVAARASPGSAGRNRTFGIERFLNQSIPIPPIEEQRRIVAKIEHFAAKIDVTQGLRDRVLTQTKALVTSIHFTKAAERKKCMGELVQLVEHREQVSLDRAYPQVGIHGFGGGLFAKAATRGCDTTYKYFNRLKAGQLVLSQVKGWEGAISVCPMELDGYYASPEYRTFDCIDDECEPEYLDIVVRSDWFRQYLADATRGQGARRERTRPELFQQIVIAIPSIDSQRKVLPILKRLQSIPILQKKTAAELDALLPSILDKAFKGEL